MQTATAERKSSITMTFLPFQLYNLKYSCLDDGESLRVWAESAKA